MRVTVVGTRLLVTLIRACRAYRHDIRFLSCLPAATGRRWRLDFVAVPARKGHGSAVLRDFLQLADDHDAEVTLNCEPALVPLYRRHGFRLVESPVQGQEVMLREARSRRRAKDRPAVRPQLAGVGGPTAA